MEGYTYVFYDEYYNLIYLGVYPYRVDEFAHIDDMVFCIGEL